MSTPINLNRVRKDKARKAKRAEADANAVKHGRTKAQKTADMSESQRAREKLDGHRHDPE